MHNGEVNQLFEKNFNLQNNLKEIKQRKIYQKFKSNHRIVGIIGSRGVGKTTYLLNYLKKITTLPNKQFMYPVTIFFLPKIN